MLSPNKTIFSGMSEVALTLFASVVVCLCHDREEQQDVVDSLPGYQFMWSQFTIYYTDFDDTLERPLSSLIRAFAHSGCFDKLDRVYALLSLAQNGHEFIVDYGIDLETLLRRTMLFCMDNRSLDDLLLLGATLIEALEFRPV